MPRPAAPRFQFVDACRGLAVIAMLAANLVNVFVHRTPWILRHNEGNVLRPFDLPAPIFQFLVGVSLALFLRKRVALGRTPPEAMRDALRRFVLLVLLGVVLDGVGTQRLRWGVLQTLGLGGMAATLLADAPTATVVGIAIGLLGPFSGAWNGVVHVDPFAALAFVPLTLAGLLAGRALGGVDPLGAVIRRCAVVGLVASALAAGLYAGGIPFNKLLGSSSFVALTVAVAAGMLGTAAAVEARAGGPPGWLAEVGRNALTAWVLLYVLVYFPAWLIFPGWRRLPLSTGVLTVFTTTVTLSLLAVALGRRGFRIPI